MTREEELQQAVDNFSEAHKYDGNLDYFSMGIAFEEGVEWADQHPDLSALWHPASEMPERFSCEILYEIRSENGFEVTYMPEELNADDWWNVLEVCGIVRWAYISDLLPKGGDK